jgi:hypothetical protein
MTNSSLSGSQLALAIIALIACVACIYMVFFFGRRIQMAGYTRAYLLESAKNLEFPSLQREIWDRACAGPLDPEYPPPEGFGSTEPLWYPQSLVTSYSQRLGNPQNPHETSQEKERRLQLLDACKKWEKEERERYKKEMQQAEQSAQKRAEERIPKSMDISLLGGGWAFLLEFSTVIVIIYTLLVLGILGALEGKEISTILAAIAGYVLGKATADASKAVGDSKSGYSGIKE